MKNKERNITRQIYIRPDQDEFIKRHLSGEFSPIIRKYIDELMKQYKEEVD